MLSKDQTPKGWARFSAIATVERLDEKDGKRSATLNVIMSKKISQCDIADIDDEEWEVLKKAFASKDRTIFIAHDRCVAIDRLCHLHFVHVAAV
jgi:hypothetical protein